MAPPPPPTAETVQVIITSTLCIFLITLRVIYRLLFRCKLHTRCHRQWHIDDLWMGASILPLLGRALCIAWSRTLAVTKVHYVDGIAVTDIVANLEVEDSKESMDARMLELKLLMPGRIFYMFFLWCMKMCLLELYLRISDGLKLYRKIGLGIRWSLYLTFVAVVFATVLECRPLKLAWNDDSSGDQCRKARGNLITMGVCNILTDLALILFPISLLRRSGLDVMRLVRLSILFALGSLIIITTIIRLPLILETPSKNTQKIRSMWASIEIACACFVANAPFFQAVILDAKTWGGHTSAGVGGGNNTGGSTGSCVSGGSTGSRESKGSRNSAGSGTSGASCIITAGRGNDGGGGVTYGYPSESNKRKKINLAQGILGIEEEEIETSLFQHLHIEKRVSFRVEDGGSSRCTRAVIHGDHGDQRADDSANVQGDNDAEKEQFAGESRQEEFPEKGPGTCRTVISIGDGVRAGQVDRTS